MSPGRSLERRGRPARPARGRAVRRHDRRRPRRALRGGDPVRRRRHHRLGARGGCARRPVRRRRRARPRHAPCRSQRSASSCPASHAPPHPRRPLHRPSRAAIVGTAPLGSVLLAMALLDEPLRPALLVGTALIVAGAALRARSRPDGRLPDARCRARALCAALFAARDNAVRWIARDDDVPPLQATAATLLAATPGARRSTSRSRGGTSREHAPARPLAPPSRDLLLAFAYGARDGLRPGRRRDRRAAERHAVAVGVAFTALVYGQREAIGRRTVLASALIVLGGALIGAFR